MNTIQPGLTSDIMRVSSIRSGWPNSGLTGPHRFCDVLRECEQASDEDSGSRELAQVAQTMETAFVTLAFKSLESEDEEGGLFGSCEQGMGYFRDLFFEHMAADLVRRRGLGFKQALTATYA